MTGISWTRAGIVIGIFGIMNVGACILHVRDVRARGEAWEALRSKRFGFMEGALDQLRFITAGGCADAQEARAHAGSSAAAGVV